MVAWMIAAGRALLGESELAVRLLPTLSVALTSLAVYRTGALLFDLRVAGTAVVWFNVTLAAGLLFVATGDAPLVMFWALSVWAVAEFVARGNPNWWLAAGLFAGLGLLSKYTAGFLGLGLLLYLVASRERLGWLRLWQVWAGGAVALLVFLPNLMWNLERGWAGVAFQGKRLDGYGTSMGSMAGNLGELLAGQALGTGVALFVFVLIGAALLALRRTARDAAGLALPILTALPMAAFFVAYTWRFRVEANWMAPIWPMLALVGAWAAARVRPARPVLGWPLRVLRGLQVPLGVVLVGVFYAGAVAALAAAPSIDRTRDMRGWAVRQEVAALAARMAPAGRDQRRLRADRAARDLWPLRRADAARAAGRCAGAVGLLPPLGGGAARGAGGLRRRRSTDGQARCAISAWRAVGRGRPSAGRRRSAGAVLGVPRLGAIARNGRGANGRLTARGRRRAGRRRRP